MHTEMNQDKDGEADEMNLVIDSKDEVSGANEWSVIFNEEMVGGSERATSWGASTASAELVGEISGS